VWSIVDNFGNHLGRQARLRNTALSLGRGLQGVGTNFLPPPAGAPGARPDLWDDLAEASAWAHAMAGAYAGMAARAAVGLLFVHEQALFRPVVGPGASDPQLFAGSHEGKTTEALVVVHAAGITARLVTPDELADCASRPPEYSVLLLVGLTQYTDVSDWSWINGTVAGDLGPCLAQFKAAGGLLACDEDSASSVQCDHATGMLIRSYVTESNVDLTGEVIGRNSGNIALFRAAWGNMSAAVPSVSVLWLLQYVF
jgi:hypothetical protein